MGTSSSASCSRAACCTIDALTISRALSSHAAVSIVTSWDSATPRRYVSARSKVRMHVTSLVSHSPTMESAPPVTKCLKSREKDRAYAPIVCAVAVWTGTTLLPSSPTRKTIKWPSSSAAPVYVHTVKRRPLGVHATAFSCSVGASRVDPSSAGLPPRTSMSTISSVSVPMAIVLPSGFHERLVAIAGTGKSASTRPLASLVSHNRSELSDPAVASRCRSVGLQARAETSPS